MWYRKDTIHMNQLPFMLHEPSALMLHEPSALMLHEPAALMLHEPSALMLHEPAALMLHEPAALLLQVELEFNVITSESMKSRARDALELLHASKSRSDSVTKGREYIKPQL